MSKNTIYRCSECEATSRNWAGKCPNCGAFMTMVESITDKAASASARSGLKSTGAVAPVKKASTISTLNKTPIKRTPTGIGEFDRVIGGGFVDAAVILFAGQPGAGKSTLCLSIADRFAEKGFTVLYSSGEESEQQIGLRAQRMSVNSDNIKIVNETNLETLLGHIDNEQPKLVIVDSLQTLATDEIPGSIGSVAQSKEVAHTLTRLAKQRGISMLLISQVIKSGDFSGSEAIQHIVDAALMLESDKDSPLKFLRASKNRFGDTSEVGVFQHSESGLEEVLDPSGIFLENVNGAVAGAACSFITEGVRQIPIEVQSLVTSSNLPSPMRGFNGVENNRARIVCAILDKFCKAKLYDNDVFVSTVSGVKVYDPQADLAIAAAMLSSLHDKAISKETTFVGEVSLTGRVRGSFMMGNKIREADRLGFTKIVIPSTAGKLDRIPKGIKVIQIESIKELIELL